MDEYVYKPVYELWQHLDSLLWHLVDKSLFHSQLFSTGCREASFSSGDGESLLSWKSLHLFDRNSQTGQASMQKVYCFYIKSLGTGYRQVISTLANSTTQSNCICRMKEVMLRSQHPSYVFQDFLGLALRWLHRLDAHQQLGCIRFTPGVCHLSQFPPHGIQVALLKSALPCNQCKVNGND